MYVWLVQNLNKLFANSMGVPCCFSVRCESLFQHVTQGMERGRKKAHIRQRLYAFAHTQCECTRARPCMGWVGGMALLLFGCLELNLLIIDKDTFAFVRFRLSELAHTLSELTK